MYDHIFRVEICGTDVPPFRIWASATTDRLSIEPYQAAIKQIYDELPDEDVFVVLAHWEWRRHEDTPIPVPRSCCPFTREITEIIPIDEIWAAHLEGRSPYV